MKTIQCPHCLKEVKVRTKLSMTVDTGKPKETTPREYFNAILYTYAKAKGVPMDKARIIFSKLVRPFYLFFDKDCQKCLQAIELAKTHYANSGFKNWTLNTITQQWESIKDGLKSDYEGW